MDELRTTILSRDTILTLLRSLTKLIGRHWGEKILAAHGGVSNVDDEKQFAWFTISSNEIVEVLQNEEKKEEFVVGEWDFFLSNAAQTETIQICHESDLHFEANASLLEEIEKHLDEAEIQTSWD